MALSDVLREDAEIGKEILLVLWLVSCDIHDGIVVVCGGRMVKRGS